MCLPSASQGLVKPRLHPRHAECTYLRGSAGACDPLFGRPLHARASPTRLRRPHLSCAPRKGACKDVLGFLRFAPVRPPRPPASPTSVATVAPRPPSAVDCKWTVLEIHRLVGVLLQNGDLCDRCWSRADQPRARQPSHRPRHARHLHLHLGARTRSALAQWPARVRLFVEN